MQPTSKYCTVCRNTHKSDLPNLRFIYEKVKIRLKANMKTTFVKKSLRIRSLKRLDNTSQCSLAQVGTAKNSHITVHSFKVYFILKRISRVDEYTYKH